MSGAGQIVAIIAIVASLFLVTPGFRSNGHSLSSTLKMALVWALIIIVGALLISKLAG